MQGDAGRTVTIRTVAQAVAWGDAWKATAERWQRMAEQQHAENERLRIFLQAADTLLAG